MTQYPQPYQPDYFNGPAVSPRPTSVTAISIVAIILGSLGLLCGGVSLLSQVMMLATGGKNPFMPTAPTMQNHAVAVFGAVAAVIMLILVGGLLAAGIGGLKLAPIARRAMIWLSVAIIGWATIYLVLTLTWIGPETARRMQQFYASQPPGTPQMPASLLGSIQMVSAFVGWVVECIFPVFVLVLWRSPRVIAAFNRTPDLTTGPTAASPFPPP